MLLHRIAVSLAAALILAIPGPVLAGIDVSSARATLVDPFLVSTFRRYMRYSAANFCLVGLESTDWDCKVCGGESAGTRVLGKLSNKLRPQSYSGYVAIEPNDAGFVFALAGTRANREWVIDALGYIPESDVHEYFPDAPEGSVAGLGFWKLFEQGIESIQWHIDNTLPLYPHIKNVAFTGHSLGGIQMNLNAGYFWEQLVSKGYTLTTYAFGPARTMNDVFAAYLTTLPAYQDGSFYRIIQRTDIVPHLVVSTPPTNYRHLGVEYFIDAEWSGDLGPVYRCPSPEPAVENEFCMRDVPLWELSMVPGHVYYLDLTFYFECDVPNYGYLDPLL